MLYVKSVPLYRKVGKKLIQMIHAGVIMDNVLPSEEALSKMFGVSRSTIREALSELTSQGIITKRQGIGNIVMDSAVNTRFRIDLKLDFAGMLAEGGYRPRFVQSLSRFEELSVDDMQGEFFVYDELLFADDQAAAAFRIHILRNKFETEPPVDLPKSNFFSFIFDYTSEVINHSIVHFEAALADETTGRRFGVTPGSPLLSWKEVFYTVRDEQVCHNRIYFNPNIFTPTMLRASFDPEESPDNLECEVTADLESYL